MAQKINDQELTAENWQPPTGIEEVKKGQTTFYRYLFGKGEGRFVNTSKFCKYCRFKADCYRGKHGAIGCCEEREIG